MKDSIDDFDLKLPYREYITMNLTILFSFITLLLFSSCESQSQKTQTGNEEQRILPGIYQLDSVLNEVGQKRVAVVSNHTGLIERTHLVDTLLSRGVKVVKVFAPEHGFRGDRSDGAKIEDSTDQKTGLPILSLYGSHKKPTPKDLKNVDVIVFDIQDVGARFYTYLSTLHYVMEAAAENNLPLFVLDRPNPNGFYVDGPIMEDCCKSFVGLHPVPIVYGMTIGEYSKMINGEKWLEDGLDCDLKVIKCQNYTHSSLYQLPVKPSPNLPDMKAIYLYPSLCLFEGTNVSVGRGTEKPFKVIGEPSNSEGDYSFVPKSRPGESLHPKHEGEICIGYDLSSVVDIQNPQSELNLTWVLQMYRESGNRNEYFNSNGYFEKLAGNKELRNQIIQEKNIDQIRASWTENLKAFREVRKKYLIYPE